MSKAAKTAESEGKTVVKTERTVSLSSKSDRYRGVIPQLEKRDGRIVEFDFAKIVSAVYKAMQAAEEGDLEDATLVAHQVAGELARFSKKYKNFLPTVEGIQDSVEKHLMLNDFVKTAKGYILYRDKRAQLRATQVEIPEQVRRLAEESKKYFRDNPLGEFVYLRTYAKWMPEEGRRETWIETVDRYVAFMRENLGAKLSETEYAELREAILKQEVMPSMRLMQFAGDAVRRCNVAAYNCSYIAPSKIADFAEIMYVSMCGTGVGYSVESQNVQALPQIAYQTGDALAAHVVEDSKEGWCDALTLGLKTWYAGNDIGFDFSKVRPAGARLKVMGGKASGPEPLRSLLQFARERVLARQGRRLRNIDAHDIICKIGECVVAGGVRRSAMISLSDLDDDQVRDAKKGQFYTTDPHRSIANNSAVYMEKPTNTEFMDEWVALMKSGSGERGIFNRGGLIAQLPERRKKFWEETGYIKNGRVVGPAGTNPCVTGDTLVYVADGRGNVPIERLAEEGKDVPVFCLDARGDIAVRTMRNPRRTGAGVDVYMVTLDDGSTIRATANHKFRLKSGEYREVRDLAHGDSLHIATRFEASIKDLFPDANARSQEYWWVNNGRARNTGEHRQIAAFHYDTMISRGFVVHHKDRDAKNNRPENLEIMSKEAHDAHHAALMQGDANPMRRARVEWDEARWAEYRAKHSENNRGAENARFSGLSHEELREHAQKLTKLLGRRFSNADWVAYAKERGVPQAFSKWRQDHLGGVSGLAKWAAFTEGIEHVDADPRVVKSYEKYTAEGYDCEIENGALVIRKQCEVCGIAFTTSISSREHGVCGIACGVRRAWATPEFRARALSGIRSAHDRHRASLAEQQAKVYSDLQFTLGRAPQKNEWHAACKKAAVSAEISRTSSPFREYAALAEHASMYNHKVLSVEWCGLADVYNGTVDEFHNFFVGGFASLTRAGKRKMAYVNNLQCGEIILKSKQFCNLTEVVARASDTKESLVRKARLATILGTYQSTLTKLNYLSREWTENCERERLLGVSITGQWDCPAVRDADALEAMRKETLATNKKYAKKFGVQTSNAITCVKPSGTVSQTIGVASGMHPRHSPYYIRRIRISATDSLFKLLRDQGVPSFPEVGQSQEDANTFVFEFPVKSPDNAVTKDNLSALDQLAHWKLVKMSYTEHNPSVTVSVGEDEWIQVANWLYNNWDNVGGLSFLPRDNHVYRLAPYEAISRERYEELAQNFAHIDYGKLYAYERQDETEMKRELSCVGNTCEIV